MLGPKPSCLIRINHHGNVSMGFRAILISQLSVPEKWCDPLTLHTVDFLSTFTQCLEPSMKINILCDWVSAVNRFPFVSDATDKYRYFVPRPTPVCSVNSRVG